MNRRTNSDALTVRAKPLAGHAIKVLSSNRKRFKGFTMPSTHTNASELSILNRIVRPEEPTFSPEGAQDIMSLGFPDSDKRRMRELSAKARAGTLTAEEDAEADRYEMLGHLLGLLQSKARRSLKNHRRDDGKKPRTH